VYDLVRRGFGEHESLVSPFVMKAGCKLLGFNKQIFIVGEQVVWLLKSSMRSCGVLWMTGEEKPPQ
jgi:hypothetical protein